MALKHRIGLFVFGREPFGQRVFYGVCVIIHAGILTAKELLRLLLPASELLILQRINYDLIYDRSMLRR